MDSALYTAASGLIAQERELDLIANNVANVSTNGYRGQNAFFEVFNRVARGGTRLEEVANNQVQLPDSWMSEKQGPLTQTGGPLDLALEGDGWFVVQTPAGDRYTRDGSLRLDSDGVLVTADGSPVLGSGGSITIPPGAKVEIAADGAVKADDAVVGQIRIAGVDSTSLEREGNGLLKLRAGAGESDADPKTTVRQGMIEGSAINPVLELIRLIAAQRSFEQYAKTLNLVVNEVDRRAVSELTQG